MLHPKSKYDFFVTKPGFIENRHGEFFHLTDRCWLVLSHAAVAPISIHDVENLLNPALEQQDAKFEVQLDQRAVEYIVSTTNRVLKAAESAYRLSARGGSFSVHSR